jgi:hypothetical protein
MQTDFIPRKDSAFNMFQRILSEQCQAKLISWNINATAFGKLQTARSPYETAYTANSNKTTRTKTDVITHRIQRNSYTKVLRAFVKEQIAGNSAISDADRGGMRLKPMTTKKGKRSAIIGAPMVLAQTMNGGWIRMTVREDTDSTRPSMHPLADAIEVVYCIGNTPPESVKVCTNTFISTKAKFIIQPGIEYAGKRIYGYVRWKNIRNNSKSGQWTSLFSRMIAD